MDSAGRLALEMRRLIDNGRVSPDSRIYLVDDGSRDNTWQLIETHHTMLGQSCPWTNLPQTILPLTTLPMDNPAPQILP